MLYHLFQNHDRSYDLPGAGMFEFISFRSALAGFLALLISITFGLGIIRFMQRRQIGEEIRNLGLEGQLQKRGTPTMGGVMILLAVLVPVLLFGRLDYFYIQLMIVSTVWLGLLASWTTTSRSSATTRRGSKASSRSWDRWAAAPSSAR